MAPEQLQRLADRLGVTVQTLPRGLTSDSANGLLHAFISVVPKAELHIHIEGSLEPSMMLELAERNGMPAPYPSVEAAQAAYNFADLQSFLDLYYNGCAVLKTTRDFYDLAWAYLRKAAANRVVHAEIFFDPQTHLANGAGFDVFMPGFLKACEDARRALGINSRLIMCFLRHLSQEDAERTLDLAKPYLSHIIGVGLDSSELGNPPLKFEKVMARVRELGLPVVAHAGEEGPAQYVWDTIKVLKASRVDHGVHSLDDPELMAHLAATQLPLTVCPLSNLKLKVYDGQLVQRLQELVLGPHALCITINSDDPAYFGGYMNQNYSWLAEELDLGISAVAQLARNGFLGSFISEDDKELYVKEVDFLEKAFLDL